MTEAIQHSNDRLQRIVLDVQTTMPPGVQLSGYLDRTGAFIVRGMAETLRHEVVCAQRARDVTHAKVLDAARQVLETLVREGSKV